MAETTYRLGTFEGSPFFAEVEIRPARQPGDVDVLSICGTHAGGGGQNLDTLRAMIADPASTWAPGWTAEKAGQLLAIWERWHLNDMRSGCVHQRNGATYREHECRSCGNHWRTEVTYSAYTPNLSGEATQFCPHCNQRASSSTPHQTMAPYDTTKPIEFVSYSIDWDERRKIERAADDTQNKSWYTNPAQLLRQLDKAGIKPFGFATISADDLVKLQARFVLVGEHDRAAKEAYAAYVQKQRDRVIASIKPMILTRTERKIANWVYPREHPDGILTKPCEVCGYAYGSQWLREELPADVRAFLEGLGGGSTVSPYDQSAAEFLERFHLTFHAEHAQAKDGIGGKRQHWRVTLRNGGARSLSFDFWNSQHDTDKGIALRAYSVLACLSADVHYTDTDELMGELGCDRKQAAAAVRFARRLQKFFTEEEIAALEGIR